MRVSVIKATQSVLVCTKLQNFIINEPNSNMVPQQFERDIHPTQMSMQLRDKCVEPQRIRRDNKVSTVRKIFIDQNSCSWNDSAIRQKT